MDASFVYEVHNLVVRNATNSTTSHSSSSSDPSRPPIYKVVGLCLAIASGLFIGTSFVLKKIGLLRANEKYNEEAGEGYGYLKNAFWWGGMTLMIVGEICNFVAYAFVDAILVTPLGALSVVVTTILSAIFLKERLSFVGKIGCFNCIVGSVVIVLNAPEQSAVADIQEMKHFVLSPGFLSYAGVVVVASAFIALWAGPRYGKKSMLVYLSVCSLIGGLSVVATQGLGSAIVAQAGGKPQFNQWFLYVLLVFVVTTLLTEIIYLNKALNLFNAALVTPTYYVFFTSATIVTSAVLFRGFKGTPISITTVIMGFLQICSGVVLLQLSKSAKDVPDAAIFKGDLDQVREVAEQEQPESEPKADAIRGAAGIIRRMSTARRTMEQREFQRLRAEKSQDLEPLQENEVVEWDGLRRRRTIIGQSPASPIIRRKTIHPPLGMSYVPNDDNSINEDDPQPSNHSGVFDAIRDRATALWHMPGHRHNERRDTLDSTDPVAMTNIEIRPSKLDQTSTSYGGVDGEDEPNHVLGLPPGLRKDSSHRKPLFSPRSKPLPAQPAPSPAPGSARRQFSFTNFIHRGQKTPIQDTFDDSLPHPRTGLASRGSSYSHEQKKAMKNATEEERLGLVKGDSHRALLESSPERMPMHPITPHHSHSNSSSHSSIEVVQAYESRSHDNSNSDDDGDWQMTPRYDPTTTHTTTTTAAPTMQMTAATSRISSANPPGSSTAIGTRQRPHPPNQYIIQANQPTTTISPTTQSHTPSQSLISPPLQQYPRMVERKPLPSNQLAEPKSIRTTTEPASTRASALQAAGPSGPFRNSSTSPSPTRPNRLVSSEIPDLRAAVTSDEIDDDDEEDEEIMVRRRGPIDVHAQPHIIDETDLQQQRFREQSQREREKRRQRQRLSLGAGLGSSGGSSPRGD